MFEPDCDDACDRRASRRLRAPGSFALAAWAAMASGCAYEPLPCRLALGEGDLVITEIRGPQEGTRGEWIELYNASGDDIDLRGLRGTLRPLAGSAVDGERALEFLVRESLPVAAGAYVVLGTLPLDATRRPEVDYSINGDFVSKPPPTVPYETPSGEVVQVTAPGGTGLDPRNLFHNARLELYACERLVDGLSYTALPAAGTLSYDGRDEPDADDNDDLSRWCTDDTEPPADGPQTATGRPGSGGEANRPCP